MNIDNYLDDFEHIFNKNEVCHFINYIKTKRNSFSLFDFNTNPSIQKQNILSYILNVKENFPVYIIVQDCEYTLIKEIEFTNLSITFIENRSYISLLDILEAYNHYKENKFEREVNNTLLELLDDFKSLDINSNKFKRSKKDFFNLFEKNFSNLLILCFIPASIVPINEISQSPYMIDFLYLQKHRHYKLSHSNLQYMFWNNSYDTFDYDICYIDFISIIINGNFYDYLNDIIINKSDCNLNNYTNHLNYLKNINSVSFFNSLNKNFFELIINQQIYYLHKLIHQSNFENRTSHTSIEDLILKLYKNLKKNKKLDIIFKVDCIKKISTLYKKFNNYNPINIIEQNLSSECFETYKIIKEQKFHFNALYFYEKSIKDLNTFIVPIAKNEFIKKRSKEYHLLQKITQIVFSQYEVIKDENIKIKFKKHKEHSTLLEPTLSAHELLNYLDFDYLENINIK